MFIFFNDIVANIYNKVKSEVSEVYNFGQKIVNGIHSGMDEIDKFLDKDLKTYQGNCSYNYYGFWF